MLIGCLLAAFPYLTDCYYRVSLASFWNWWGLYLLIYFSILSFIYVIFKRLLGSL